MIDPTPWAGLMLGLLLLWPGYNLALTVFAWWRPRPTRLAAAVPGAVSFWIVIPALNEERVVAATVRSALALDRPDTPLRVLVVDDGSDDATPDILDDIIDPRLHVLRRDPPRARTGKGEALNAAFRYIRAESRRDGSYDRCVLGVIDGDGRGTPGMLGEIVRYFADPTVAGVQCRVRIHNRDRLLAFLQDLEFSCVADAAQSMRDPLGSAELGGNGQFVRLRSLDRLGPSPWSRCLVEDLELGLRLHLAGERIRYASHVTITQQGLVDVPRMIRQRTRWSQGNLQCLRYVPRLVACPAVSGPALLEFLYYLLTPWLIAPLSIVVAGMVGLTLVGLTGLLGATPGLPALALWLVAFVLPGLLWGLVHRLRHGDEPLHRTLLVGLIYPVFLLIGVVAAWRALGRHLSGRHTWAKTDRLVEEPEPV